MEAVLVVGPESSGTRMIAEVFVKNGYFGDYDHTQRLDDEDFSKAEGKLVFRQSYPHGKAEVGKRWPSIPKLCEKLRQAGYDNIKLVITLRDKDYMAYSQVHNSHQMSFDNAKCSIETATQMIFEQAARMSLYPYVLMYEPFVRCPEVRFMFYKHFDLQTPAMTFQDGNEKYNKIWYSK